MKRDIICTVFMIGLLLIIRDDTWLNKEPEIQEFFQKFITEREDIGVSFVYEAGAHDYGIAYFADGAMGKLKRQGKEQWSASKLAQIKAKIQTAIDQKKAWIGNVEDNGVDAKCLSFGLKKKEDPQP